jgi:hypothetical protein
MITYLSMTTSILINFVVTFDISIQLAKSFKLKPIDSSGVQTDNIQLISKTSMVNLRMDTKSGKSVLTELEEPKGV